MKINRKWFTDKSTIGKLYIDDKFFCYTLEDVVRPVGEKLLGKTAIPWGKYRVILSMSNRFKKVLPLLLDVPMFEGIRIHAGNSAVDTEGCILLGYFYDPKKPNWIGNSNKAVEDFITIMKNKKFVSIEIGAEAT